jgi:hypothetical protein
MNGTRKTILTGAGAVRVPLEPHEYYRTVKVSRCETSIIHHPDGNNETLYQPVGWKPLRETVSL